MKSMKESLQGLLKKIDALRRRKSAGGETKNMSAEKSCSRNKSTKLCAEKDTEKVSAKEAGKEEVRESGGESRKSLSEVDGKNRTELAKAYPERTGVQTGESVEEKRAEQQKCESKTVKQSVTQQKETETARQQRSGWESCLPDMHTCENEDRRFTLLVTEVYEPKEGNVRVKGFLHGCMHKGDTIWVIHPFGGQRMNHVVEIYVETEGETVTAENAEDKSVEVSLDTVLPGEMELFSVITGICPQDGIDLELACENPDVLGRGYDFPRFRENPLYRETLLYAIAHGYYVLPLRKKDSLYRNTEELLFSDKDSFIRLRHPTDTGRRILPVFTDWQEMQGWEDVITEKEAVETLTLTFLELAEIVTDDRDDDLVINLFRGHPLILSADMVCDVRLLGYVSPDAENKMYS